MHVEVVMAHRVGAPVSNEVIGPAYTDTVEVARLSRLLADRQGRVPAPPDTMVGPAAEGEMLPQRGILLTFDDGYRDFLTNALPVLEQYAVPAIIFVVTGYVTGEVEPPEVRVARVVESTEEVRLPGRGVVPSATIPEKWRAYEFLRRRAKRRGAASREDYLTRIETLNGRPDRGVESAFLTWKEIRDLDRHPLVTIGAHGHSHPLLTRCMPRYAYEEMAYSKKRLEREVGHPVDYFAYPYGGQNWWLRFLAAAVGYRAAFSTHPGWWDPRKLRRRYRIPRFDINDLVAAEGGRGVTE